MFLKLLLLLFHKIVTISGHSSRPHIPLADYTLERQDDSGGSPKSSTDFGNLGLVAKVEAMAAKMERMEEMFMKREEEMKLELREMEQRMEMQETKIRAELDTIREAPQVFKLDLFHLFHYYELSGAVLRLPEQMELHRNSDIFPIHLKLQQCGPGVKYTLSIQRGFLQTQL